MKDDCYCFDNKKKDKEDRKSYKKCCYDLEQKETKKVI